MFVGGVEVQPDIEPAGGVSKSHAGYRDAGPLCGCCPLFAFTLFTFRRHAFTLFGLTDSPYGLTEFRVSEQVTISLRRSLPVVVVGVFDACDRARESPHCGGLPMVLRCCGGQPLVPVIRMNSSSVGET